MIPVCLSGELKFHIKKKATFLDICSILPNNTNASLNKFNCKMFPTVSSSTSCDLEVLAYVLDGNRLGENAALCGLLCL